MSNLVTFVDQAGALAIIGLLSAAYGSIWRQFENRVLTAVTLGFLFSVVALMQMYAPIEAGEGVIIDMRNVPVALAGAFLGFRGMIMCLFIAASARFAIGGIGWVPGVIGMSFAGLAGLVWAWRTKSLERRGFTSLLCLGGLTSVHLVGALWLPWDTAVWFFLNAAPFLIILNILTIPIVGTLLERETQLMLLEQKMNDTSRTEPITQMLKKGAFLQELKHRKAAAPLDVTGVMVLTLRRQKQFLRLLGKENMEIALGAIRVRLQSLMTHGDATGIASDGRILIALSADEVRTGDMWQVALRRSIRDAPITLSGGIPVRLMLTCEILKTTEIDEIEAHMDTKATARPLFIDEVELGTRAIRATSIAGPTKGEEPRLSPKLDTFPLTTLQNSGSDLTFV